MSSKYLSLAQRVGGAMSVGATNATEKEFNQPFNVSSGAGMKVKKTKKVKGGSVYSEDVVEGGAVKKPKKTRKPSLYNAFVKANYAKAKHLPAKERLGFIAKMWKLKK